MNEKSSAIETSPPESDADDPTDSQLLARFIDQKDQAAFEALVRAHGPMVFGVCRRILKRFQDAEDAFQATFLSLATNAVQIGRRELVVSWLYTVARRVAIKRKKIAAKRRQVELQLEHQMRRISESNLDHEELWSDLIPVLDKEIERLGDDLRAAVILCDVEGKTRKEAARQLGCPEATVSTRLMKARSLLAQRLKRQGVIVSAAALGLLLSQNAASAAVPELLVATTLQTASVVSLGQGVAAGIVSPQVIALTKGTVNSVLFFNVKMAVAALVVVAAGGLAVQLQQAKPPVAQVANDPPQNGKVVLPAAIQKALEQNAAQLNPITISYTEQLRSRLPEEETFERLKISKYRSPRRIFQEGSFRVIGQEPKFYTFSKGINGSYSDDNGYREAVREHECAFDGNILYQGDRSPGSAKTQPYLLLERRIPNNHFGSSYFSEDFTGICVPLPGAERESGMRFESSVLANLRRGGELISVSEVLIDGHPLVKIELRTENMDKTWADQTDIEQSKRAYSSELYTTAEREQFLANVIASRALPKTKRVVFFLDPAMSYAVIQKEEWHDPETLVHRSRCSDFLQLPNRQLWLPRAIEIDYRMFHTAPGVVFADPFLSKVFQVTQLSGERVPDSQFVLDYKEPGTYIMDMRGTDAAGKTTGKQPPHIGYSVGQTPKETQANREDAVRRAAARQSDNQSAGGLAAAKPQSAVGWLLLVNVVAFVLIGGFFAYRRFFGSK